jgi:phosphoglucosamine mutase
MKLDDRVEDEIEALIEASDGLEGVPNAEIGAIRDRSADLRARYVAHRAALASTFRSSLHVVVDGANGSGCAVVGSILAATGARVEVVHDRPDGVNINLGCGATDPVSLAREVVERGADVGFALDGDADRCVAVDATGRIVDGDQLIGLLALDRMARGALPHGRVVASVLSNGGLELALEDAGGSLVRTPVGDKYILEGMLANDAALGGEKSGHVIFRELSSTGDGIVTAIEVLRVVSASGGGIADLAARIPLFPQVQRAIRVPHKERWETDPALVAAVDDARRRLGRSGRILVRPSGTEPVLRIMVEGPDADLVTRLADDIGALAEDRLH